MINLKNIFIFLICLSCLSAPASASNFTINGSISSLGLPQGNVRIDLSNVSYTFSNINGFYEIREIPEGNYTILIRKIKFNDLIQEITLNINQTINFSITERARGGQATPGFSFSCALFIILIFWITKEERRK